MNQLNRNFFPERWEWLVVAGLLAVGMLFNLNTFNLYPTVWADEVLWSEPAINLVKTGHFTTSVWQFQRAGSFWAAQSPLYCFGLAGWMKIIGTDLLAARSFNFALVSLGIFLTWFATWHCKLIFRPSLRILAVPLLLCGYGMSFAFRCSRPDIAGMICLLCLALAFFIRHDKLRPVALFLCASATPWIGIQVALFAAVSCGLAWLFFNSLKLKTCILVGTGIFMGMASMLAFYQAHGVLADLMASIMQAAHEKQHLVGGDSYGSSIPLRLRETLAAFTSDLSGGILLVGIVMLVACQRGSLCSRLSPGNWFLASIIITIPVVFNFTGHFAFYYAYMIYIPLVLVFLSALEKSTVQSSRILGVAGIGVAAAACLVGLPLRLWISIHDCDIAPRTRYAPIIQAALSAEDVVFAHYTAFFECKDVAPKVYSPMYSRRFVDLSPSAQDFTDEEKRRVNVLAIPVSKIDEMKLYWGNEWIAVTPPLGDSIRNDGLKSVPFIGKRVQSYLSNPQAIREPLQVLRRTGFATSTTESNSDSSAYPAAKLH